MNFTLKKNMNILYISYKNETSTHLSIHSMGIYNWPQNINQKIKRKKYKKSRAKSKDVTKRLIDLTYIFSSNCFLLLAGPTKLKKNLKIVKNWVN